MTSFLNTQNNSPGQPSQGGFLPPAGNPYVPPQTGFAAAPTQAYQNPESMYQSASMMYQQLGYWNGNPTEVDIISDLLKAQTPMATFLASEQGLPIMAQLFSVLFDFKMTSFFKDFRLAIVQDEGGNMFIAPAVEQTTERGKALATTTQAEVQTEMANISDTLRNTLIAGSEQIISTHKQAASIKAQSSGLTSIIDEATGGTNQNGGGLTKLVNFALRAGGAPIPPVQQGGPPPPPGR
ncbi:MAG: hypothetical protein CMA60_00190 [Euryarchaeota archaeon]|nr:hypothetical protein [Euryarchaeota archaeon]|tara:strand:- start:3406 stop:4119 length:714 start_codon:yes stop_codon:yes gene_type:complete